MTTTTDPFLTPRQPPPRKRRRLVPEVMCVRPGCGHPASWHRLDSSTNVAPTDPNAMFRCIGYDCTVDEFHVDVCIAACPDFMDPETYGPTDGTGG